MIPYLIVFPIIWFVSLDKRFRIPALILLVLFIGLRWNVGTDFMSYLDIFNLSGTPLYSSLPVEWGYLWLNRIFASYEFSFSAVTMVQAIWVMTFIYLGLKDYSFYPFSILIFLLDINCGYTSTVNIMRQAMAMAILFFAIKYIVEHSFYKYLICVLIACCFHISAIIALPIYFLNRFTFNQWILTLIYLIVFAGSIFRVWDTMINNIMSMTLYGGYLYSQYNTAVESNSGIIMIIWRAFSLLIILNYNKIAAYNPSSKVYLNIYCVFSILRDLFSTNLVIVRLILYFQLSELIVIPILFLVLLKNRNSRIICETAFILFLCVLFVNHAISHADSKLIYHLA